ncbi:hypothetical protein MferCBS31731_003378 [Microsporum ferrugineum]
MLSRSSIDETRLHAAYQSRHLSSLTGGSLGGYRRDSSQIKIKRLARQGGSDLSDLRKPHIPCYRPISTTSLDHQKRHAQALLDNSSSGITSTTSSIIYNRNFEQKLLDHGVYPHNYHEYPDGQPNNWEVQPRALLSSSKFSKREFKEFVFADLDTCRTDDIKGDFRFGNLAPLTDDTIPNAKPGHFFGAHPEQLNPEVRDDLSSFIIPSTQGPIAPNFFLEAKSTERTLTVTIRQACYHGALGARGIHKLQSYKQDEPICNSNAYTITSTYHDGSLRLYTIHPIAPGEKSGCPEYIMNPLRSFAMTDRADTFRSGACVYQNARDWAKERRDEFIRFANERHLQSQSGLPPTKRGQTSISNSKPIVALEGSNTSATSDAAELCTIK